MNRKIAFFMAVMILLLSPVSYIQAADGPSNRTVSVIVRNDAVTDQATSVTDTGAAGKVETGGSVDSGSDTGISDTTGSVDTGSAADTGNPDTGEENIPKLMPTLFVDEAKMYIAVDDDDFIVADYDGDDNVELEYTSLDESIVEVDEDGAIYGAKIGKTKVVVKAPETENYKSVSVKVTVVVTAPYKLALKTKKFDFKAGESDTITYKLSDPHGYGINPKLKFKSSNKKVAKVTKKGKVTAVAAGKCTVSVTDAYGLALSVKVTVSKPDTSKYIYLTYDDGPGSQITPELLDVLKEYNAEATFFLVGYQAANNKSIVKRQKNEGHTIAIHTYTHDYKKIYASADAYLADFNKTEKLIQDLTGDTPKYWRFPGGGNNSYISSATRSKIMDALHKRGYKEMDWSAATNDATGVAYSAQEMIDFGISTIKSAIKNKKAPVVLMHDWNAKKHTPEVTKAILEYFTKRGYTFKGLNDYYGEEMSFKK